MITRLNTDQIGHPLPRNAQQWKFSFIPVFLVALIVMAVPVAAQQPTGSFSQASPSSESATRPIEVLTQINPTTWRLAGDLKTDYFELPKGVTLLVEQDAVIEVDSAIVLRGMVRVELPADAQQGAWAPFFILKAAEYIVMTGEMTFGDGADGRDPGAMGGGGASLSLWAPVIAIGVEQLTMGNGGHGGPGTEGGPGGLLDIYGWVVPFAEKQISLRSGDGGDGGDGLPGTEIHPRGHRGGNGGPGGRAMHWGTQIGCLKNELPLYLSMAIGTDDRLDSYLEGPHRLQAGAEITVNGQDGFIPETPIAVAGKGGDGGDGGVPWEPMANKAGGGRGGDGGDGGFATGIAGLPGTTVTPADIPGEGVDWTGGYGTNGGEAIGGDGGSGGDDGPPGRTAFFMGSYEGGGDSGDGGRAVGGMGGDAGVVNPPKRYSLRTGRAGHGGRPSPGMGGHAAPGGDSGKPGAATRGQPGQEVNPEPSDQPAKSENP